MKYCILTINHTNTNKPKGRGDKWIPKQCPNNPIHCNVCTLSGFGRELIVNTQGRNFLTMNKYIVRVIPHRTWPNTFVNMYIFFLCLLTGATAEEIIVVSYRSDQQPKQEPQFKVSLPPQSPEGQTVCFRKALKMNLFLAYKGRVQSTKNKCWTFSIRDPLFFCTFNTSISQKSM